ncbi:MAG TPA: hypothetical protein PLX04_01390 [Caldisericia bacterium]|nr:hypothetical protein [Caldisericia bacterium]HPL88902.1 hypothetical protein [Caldisericia bacterium]HQG60082.1 hypothetical protein [Caldisericia bacterium]HQH49487.1 hypothetical protein [Caldisericia bacterium]HQJ44424.1 hypothetical protein [Caldisericia bacterium]
MRRNRWSGVKTIAIVVIIVGAIAASSIFIASYYKMSHADHRFHSINLVHPLSEHYVKGDFIKWVPTNDPTDRYYPVLLDNNKLVICRNELFQEVIGTKTLPGKAVSVFDFESIDIPDLFMVCETKTGNELLHLDANLDVTSKVKTEGNKIIGGLSEKRVLLLQNEDTIFLYDKNLKFVSQKHLDKKTIFPKNVKFGKITPKDFLVGFDGSSILSFDMLNGFKTMNTVAICENSNMNETFFKPLYFNDFVDSYMLYNGKTLYLLDEACKILNKVDLEGARESYNNNIYPFKGGLYYFSTHKNRKNKYLSKVLDNGEYETIPLNSARNDYFLKKIPKTPPYYTSYAPYRTGSGDWFELMCYIYERDGMHKYNLGDFGRRIFKIISDDTEVLMITERGLELTIFGDDYIKPVEIIDMNKY